MDPFEYPNLQFMRYTKFSTYTCNNSEHFWKHKKYNTAGWLALAYMNKLLKEKHELPTQKLIRILADINQAFKLKYCLAFLR